MINDKAKVLIIKFHQAVGKEYCPFHGEMFYEGKSWPSNWPNEFEDETINLCNKDECELWDSKNKICQGLASVS